MSQRECSGFNAPRFSVGAGDEVVGGPEASAATLGNWSSRVRSDPSGFVPVVAMPGVSFQSRLLHVGHPAKAASAGNAPPA